MKLGIKGTAFVVLACAFMAFVSDTRAQATNDYLTDLRAEIELRAGDEEATKQEKATLKAAGNKLKKVGKNAAAQLRQLATAATILNKRYTNDTTLDQIQVEALAAYLADAETQLASAEARVGTNAIPPGLRKQLDKARDALDAAVNDTNGVPAQARLLAKAYNKMRLPLKQVEKRFGNEEEPPPGPFQAPESLAFGTAVRLLQDADHAPILTDMWTFATPEGGGEPYLYYHYHISGVPPEGEIGTWTYQKTGEKAALIHIDADYPANAMNRDVTLNFTSATKGTFSMTIVHGDMSWPVTGKFTIFPPGE